MSIGAEMENNLRKERQTQGIALAKAKGLYQGRLKGSTASPEALKHKYWDVLNLLRESRMSMNQISKITGRSINTVRKVKESQALYPLFEIYSPPGHSLGAGEPKKNSGQLFLRAKNRRYSFL